MESAVSGQATAPIGAELAENLRRRFTTRGIDRVEFIFCQRRRRRQAAGKSGLRWRSIAIDARVKDRRQRIRVSTHDRV